MQVNSQIEFQNSCFVNENSHSLYDVVFACVGLALKFGKQWNVIKQYYFSHSLKYCNRKPKMHLHVISRVTLRYCNEQTFLLESRIVIDFLKKLHACKL